MTESVQVSIIIPAKDHTAYLTKLLQGIRRHAPSDIGYEIIVVDDASQDDLAPLAREYGAICLREETSRGPAHARNVGAARARGALFFFLDADVEYAQGLMERAVTLLEENPELAAVSFIDQPYRRGDGVVRNYGALIEYYYYQELVGHKSWDRISAFTTRNGIVRAATFHEVGGFNEEYVTNAIEDYDFGKRLAARFPVAMSNGPLLYHNFPDSLRRLLRNYWVRTRLFVPFYLDKRPPLDKAMISTGEAALRTLGFCGVSLLVSAVPLVLFGAAPALVATVAGLACLAVYVLRLREFLALVARHSGSVRFVATCVVIHVLSSIVIVLGGAWGLAACFMRPFVARRRLSPADAEPSHDSSEKTV